MPATPRTFDTSGKSRAQIHDRARCLVARERLSPTRELAIALRVSRSTVTVAYENLLSEGFATSHTGAVIGGKP
jgi:DNA-binding transcriptional MocR family regulator